MRIQSIFKISIAILIFTTTFNLNGQIGWHLYKDAPENLSPIQIESTDDGTLYVLTDQGKLYYRESGDSQWSSIKNVQAFWNHDNFKVHPVNKRLFVGTSNGGIVYTDDYGESWDVEYFFTLPNSGFHAGIDAIVIDETIGMTLLAGGINVETLEYANYQSFNNGNTWQTLDAPTTGFVEFHLRENGHIFASGSTGLFTESEGLFLSQNHGATWTNIGDVWGIIMTDFAEEPSGRIFATVPETNQPSGPGVYVSIDDGESWSVINDGLGSMEALCVSYDAISGDILLGAKDGMYRFDVDTWMPVIIPFNDEAVNDIHVKAGTVHAASNFFGIYQKEVSLTTWDNYNQGLNGGLSEYIFNGSDMLIAGSDRSRGYASLDNVDDAWERHQLPENTDKLGIVQMKRLNNDDLYILDFNELFYSTNDGETFENITPDLPIPANAFYRRYERMDVTEDGEILIHHFNHDTIYHSFDGGINYEVLFDINDVPDAIGSSLIIDDFFQTSTAGYVVLVRDATLEPKLLRSMDGTNWQVVDFGTIDPNNNGSRHALHKSDNGNILFSFSHQPYVLNPADNSFTEIPVPWEFSNPNSVFDVFQDSDDVIYITVYPTSGSVDYQGVWRTSDEGLNWTALGFPEDDFGDDKYSATIRFNSNNTPFILSGIPEPGTISEEISGVYYYGEEGIFLGLDNFFASEAELLLYPNPISSDQVINIEGVGINVNASITLVDMQGRMVPISVDYGFDSASISTFAIAQGIYQLGILIKGQKLKSVRLIVQ